MDDEEEYCEGCGDGDFVPQFGYFRCPVCDAEWDDPEVAKFCGDQA